MNGLIGSSGFVGSTLLRQTKFDRLYRSTNIEEIRGQKFDFLVCAGAPAQKWIANKNPDEDIQNINKLIENLNQTTAKVAVLVSTVDVFKDPVGVSEKTEPTLEGLHPYGKNRLHLEKAFRETFPNSLIVRLPGLVGPGLRKNIIFDFLNSNNVSSIESRSVFQFYPMVNFWSDIAIALRNKIDLLHLTAEPISVHEIARDGFNIEFNNQLANTPVRYDLKSEFASHYGGSNGYQYSKKETLLATRAYAQSEPHQGLKK